ncbi:hypothetical protein ACWEOG_23755, partial [Amycolatopsis japonica]
GRWGAESPQWSMGLQLHPDDPIVGDNDPFTDLRIATRGSTTPQVPAVTADAREGPLPSAQPRKLDLHTFPKYVKAPFTASSAMKAAFTYCWRRVS